MRRKARSTTQRVIDRRARDQPLRSDWKAQSFSGQSAQAIEPAVAPLGWDWRIGMAALASFPAARSWSARSASSSAQGEGEAGDDEYRDSLGACLAARPPVFSVPVALSVMVFFALCCQCVSTLVVIKRETNSWRWPVFTFVYMTVLAYVAALATYQPRRSRRTSPRPSTPTQR